MNDMIKIKLVVEQMRAEIVKVFDANEIATSIAEASKQAVDEFDMDEYITSTIDMVFRRARDVAVNELSCKYGEQWAADVQRLIDTKIAKVLTQMETL